MTGLRPFSVGHMRSADNRPAMPVVPRERVRPHQTLEYDQPFIPPIPVKPLPNVVLSEEDVTRIARAVDAMRKGKRQPENPDVELRAISVRTIANIVSAVTDVSLMSLVSDRRDFPTTKARHIVFWLARRFTPWGMPTIGSRIGGRDHTSVLHGARRVSAIIKILEIAPEPDHPHLWAERLWAPQWPSVSAFLKAEDAARPKP